MIYGIDIGGTKIEMAIYNSGLTLQNKLRISTPTLSYPEFLSTLVQLIRQADERYGCKGVLGIGLPGLTNRQGQTLSSNVPCANGKNVLEDLQSQLKRPIAMENDARCFALSEANLGAGEGYQRVYGAIVGTGAAGGLCIHKKLDQGKNKISGEYGHIPLPAFLQRRYQLPGYQCGCGLPDCMEQYVAGPGLGRLYQHFSQGVAGVFTAPACIDAMRYHDATAYETFTCYIDLLGFTFAQLVKAHDPDIIVVGGGMSKVDEVMQGLPSAMQAYLFSTVEPPPVVSAKFGDAGGTRGAAILGQQHG